MLRSASFVITAGISLALLLGCGEKQNPLGDYRPSGPGDAGGTDASGGVPSYAKTIAPMMAASCAMSGCHDGTTRVAGVALDTYDDVKANAEASNTTIQNKTMPMGSAPPLTDADRQSFDSWVKAGAPNN